MYFKKVALIILAPFVASQLSGAQMTERVINPSLVRSRIALGNIAVANTGNDFAVIKDGIRHEVASYDVSPTLRKVMKHKALEAMLAQGYIEVKELNDGKKITYTVDGRSKGLGGGPGLGLFVYGLVKGLLWGGVSAGVGTLATGTVATVVVTGGTALLPGGAIAAASGAVVTGVGGAALAAELTTAAAMGFGVAASIEAIALGAGAAFGMLPTP